jgi:hypothetical protein
MGASQTKNNLRWSVFVFAFLCLVSSALYVAADEVSTTDVVVFDDADTDGLSNEEEKIYGTDLDVADTDGDGYSDGVEVEGGFDPLKPAPGDRVTPVEVKETGAEGPESTVTNLTTQATNALVDVISTKGEDGEITSEDLNSVLLNLTPAQEDITLPDVDVSSLKVKKLSSELTDDEKKEANREDVVKYLTLVSYILITNAPVQIHDAQALEGFTVDAGQHMILGLMTGDYSYIDMIEDRSKKALSDINNVEVPESMVNTHVKAVRMLTFASNLKQSIKTNVSPDDPLGQMYMFSKVQGLLLTIGGFMSETQNMLTDIGVKNIPLDI